MPLLKEVPKEVKRGLGRERRRIQRKWVKKNWKWIVPACVGTIIAILLFLIWVFHNSPSACLVRSHPEIVGEIRVENGKCNNAQVNALDLSQYKSLKRIVIGDDAFMNVNEVKMIGLRELESVEIGMNSFTRKKSSYGNDPNRRFYLKDCSSLRQLTIDSYSFSDYSVIEIENVNSLETIEIGEMNGESCSFYHASLELKSIQQKKE